MMQLHISADPARAAATFIAGQLTDETVIGVATGRTSRALYSALAGMDLQIPKTGFALDEYVGLSAEDPGSFASYVARLIEPAFKMTPGAIAIPNGDASDPAQEAKRFEAAISETPISIQILGVGTNGHIAFNEPGSSADSTTRVVELTAQTKEDNAADVHGPVPDFAITQGIGTIRRAGTLCLLATGKAKSEAIAKLVSGQKDLAWPVTLIADHPKLNVFVDPAAASGLNAQGS